MTAVQNLENLFTGFPVHHRRTLKVRLEEVEKFEEEEEAKDNSIGQLLEKVLGCLNPFSQYIIREMNRGDDSTEKVWELDEAIFKGRKIKKENLFKTSAEMFVIYKYTNDPRMIVKSSKYTDNAFTECKDLLPKEEAVLFETSVLNDIQAQEIAAAAAEATKQEEMKK
jgi:hypothetical protein